MRAAVSENRRSVSCFAWIGYRRAEPRAANPGRSGPVAAPGRCLGLLASLALLQSGCQSGPFSHCGDGSGLFGPCGFFSRVSARVFNRTNRAGDCCEPGMVTGTPVEYAAPATVLTPGCHSVVSGGGNHEVGRARVDRFVDRVVPGRSPREGEGRATSLGRRIELDNGRRATGPQGASYQTRGQDSGARLARRRSRISRARRPSRRLSRPYGRPGRRRSSSGNQATTTQTHSTTFPRSTCQATCLGRDAAGSSGGPAGSGAARGGREEGGQEERATGAGGKRD